MIESDLQAWKEPLQLPGGRLEADLRGGGMEPPGRDKQCWGANWIGGASWVMERWEEEGLEKEQWPGKLSLSWRGCCRWSCPSGYHWPSH